MLAFLTLAMGRYKQSKVSAGNENKTAVFLLTGTDDVEAEKSWKQIGQGELTGY